MVIILIKQDNIEVSCPILARGLALVLGMENSYVMEGRVEKGYRGYHVVYG